MAVSGPGSCCKAPRKRPPEGGLSRTRGEGALLLGLRRLVEVAELLGRDRRGQRREIDVRLGYLLALARRVEGYGSADSVAGSPAVGIQPSPGS